MKFLNNAIFNGTITANSVADAGTNTDKFLVLNSSGLVTYRTAAELYADLNIGALPAGYTSAIKHEVKAGVAINKGQAVYVSSSDGTNMIVSKASNAAESTSSKTMGLLETTLAINGKGNVVTEGLLAGLDTSGATNPGDPVWLGTNGDLIYGLTNKPYAPAHLVFIGIVTRINANNGEIFVKVQNGFELNELHNVSAQSPSNGNILQYNSSTSLWTAIEGTTTNITEGTNLYYTDARARGALSFTAGSGAYNSTTGVITIPTNTNQLTNGASFITLTSLSAGAGIYYDNTSGVISSTIVQYTDAMARAAISLTTTGTSGAATYNSTTGVLNIPQYQAVLTNPVTGTGTTNTLPKFTGTSAIGNSNITDTGSLITLGSDTTISSGGLGIGTTSLTNYGIRNSKNITGAVTSYGMASDGTVQSDVTSAAYYNRTLGSTQATTFTLGTLGHYMASQGTIGSGSTVTNQYGFIVLSTLTGATNNYAFAGQLAAATNTWNLYMSGTANNYLAGSLGIGRTSLSNIVLGMDKNITGSTVAYGVYNVGTIQSDVTSSAAYNVTSAQTAAASFTLNNLYHYLVSQSTIGAGSTVTSQYGYHVSSNMIGATNNYGFRSQIPSGTGRWNIFMDGTADNYLAGNVGIGVASSYVSSGTILTTTLTDGGTGYVDGTYTDVASSIISGGVGVYALFTITVSGGVVTTATLSWGGSSYKVGDTLTVSNTLLGGTGSGLVITVATVDSSSIKITNANGSDITLMRNDTALATNDNIGSIKWEGNDATAKSSGIFAKLSAFAAGSSGGAYLSFFTSTGAGGALTEQLRIGSGGQVGIGGAYSLTGYGLRVSKDITGATSSYGIQSDGVIQSGVTTAGSLYRTFAQTAASTFTLTSLSHYIATQGTFGSGSTVTSQLGFAVDATLVGATNNYGFYGNMPSGTGRWNLYMNGTAANYLNGNTGIGSTIPSGKLEVNVGSSAAYFTRTAGDNGAVNPALGILTSTTGARIYSYGAALEFFTAAVGGTVTEKMRLSDIGSFGIGTGSSINASAKVQIDSTTQGFLPPRMTSAQRVAISTPATGLVVYQTDGTEGVYVYTSAGWKSLTMV